MDDLSLFFDEVLPSDLLVGGYQNADYVQPFPVDDAYQWDELCEDDWWLESHTVGPDAPPPIQQQEWDWDEVTPPDLVVTGYQNADYTPPVVPSQPADAEWDFDGDFGGEDGWSNHFTNYDLQTPIYDLDWDWDEVLPPEFVVLGYQQADAVQVPTQYPQGNDAEWNWDESVEDEWQDLTDDTDDAVGPDASPLITTQDVWDWDEAVEDELPADEHTKGSGGVRHAEAAFDWADDIEDDWLAWSEFSSGPVADVAQAPAAQVFDDPWFEDDVADDWSADDQQLALVAPNAARSSEDHWWFDEAVEDELAVQDGGPVVPDCAQPTYTRYGWLVDARPTVFFVKKR